MLVVLLTIIRLVVKVSPLALACSRGRRRESLMNNVLESFGITPIINAAGSVTHLSASPVAEEIALGMAAAAQLSIDMADAQGRACLVIARHTGADAGIVTSGAAAGLLLGAAACMAKLDAALMARLPDTAGLKNEFVVPRGHRNSYDHAVRAAGAKLIDVGYADRQVGVGIRDTEVWELEAAVTERTAGLFYVARPGSRPALAQVAMLAQRRRLPLLVDAAAELPPAANLRRYIEEGADLVVFSGGKAIGGPMASGILCGRRDLIASALLQQLDLDFDFDSWRPPSGLIDKASLRCVPRHGIGRACKVGKEQLVGLLLALEKFAATPDSARSAHLTEIAVAVLQALAGISTVKAQLILDPEARGIPRVQVSIGTPKNAQLMVERLRDGTPSVRVDTSRVAEGLVLLLPTCLQIGDAVRIAAAFKTATTYLDR